MPPSPALKTVSFRNVSTQFRKRKKNCQRKPPPARRAVSTISSVTAVNAKKDIPHAFRDLYEGLTVLQKEAAVYTKLGQLQLALRGLESENGITRVAGMSQILSGADGRTTLRLVKVLLADPLAPAPEWEKQLSSLDDNDGRALLLRYGERLEFDRRHPLVRTLHIPSIILHNHNLEILVQTASTQSEGQSARAQTYLVPGLETPTSATGRYSTVIYPVHKALVLVHGLDGIKTLPSASLNGEGVGEDMVTAVIDTPWGNLSSRIDSLQPLNPISLGRADDAIATFRESLDNSFNYEHAWFESGLPRMSAWLIEGTESLPGNLKPTIRRLIEALADDVEHAIDQEESEQLQKQASSVVPSATRELMNSFITNWAEAAHTELRIQLDLAFASKNWRKLAWWKLAWRVDDVTYITSDILRHSWLVDADKGILYLAGRIEQAGLLPSSVVNAATGTKSSPDTNPYDSESNNIPAIEQSEHSNRTFTPTPPTIMFSDMFPLSDPGVHPVPYSQSRYLIPSIAQHREYLLASTVPALQFLAQRLLLHTLSTTVLASSLSALMYVSISTTSVYEAGSVAAL
ncbi:MAG: hypothetical protein L6R39_006841, partial [Caloplaca ligustica]